MRESGLKIEKRSYGGVSRASVDNVVCFFVAHFLELFVACVCVFVCVCPRRELETQGTAISFSCV